MRIPRFLCPAASVSKAGDVVALDPRESRHLTLVLRRGTGDALRVLPGNGTEWEAVVVSSGPGPATVRLERLVGADGEGAVDSATPERPLAISGVAVALARGGAFELALEHLTELGADEIIPLRCSRCVVRVSDPADIEKKLVRWERVLEGAAKQSGRRTLPVLSPPADWEDWVARELDGQSTGETASNTGLWVATPEGLNRPLFDDVIEWLGMRKESLLPPDPSAGEPRASRVLCAIGPEGGFTPEEVRFALDRGARPAWLGDHVLRVATAAAAAMTTIRLAIRNSDP